MIKHEILQHFAKIPESSGQIPENLKTSPNIANVSGSDYMQWCPGSKLRSTKHKVTNNHGCTEKNQYLLQMGQKMQNAECRMQNAEYSVCVRV